MSAQHCIGGTRLTLVSIVIAASQMGIEDVVDGSCPYNGCDSDDVTKFTKLFSWTQEGIDSYVRNEDRAELPKLSEVLARRGRTFIAKRKQHVGDLLMRLPRQNLIHAGNYIACGECPNATLTVALKKGIGSNKSVYMPVQSWLALYIMEHRRLGNLSQWKVFLDLLPTDFQDYPIFYTQETFDWLQGSTFVSRVKKHLKNIEAQFQTVCHLVPGFADNYTVEEFMWARSIVGSRSFGWKFPGLPQKYDSFLAPLGDMFNHRNSAKKMVDWQYNETTDSLDYWVREEISVGDEILISYGTHSNSNFLLHYGFVLPDLKNSVDLVSEVMVVIDLEILADVPDLEAKKQWLAKASHWYTESRVYTPVEINLKKVCDKEFEKMIGHARLLELRSMSELEQRVSSQDCKRVAVPPNCDRPVSVSNERAAVKRCLALIQLALKAYPTTLEEDERILSNLEGLHFSLVIVRRDEKLVLHWWETYLLLSLELLDGGHAYTWMGADRVEQRCNNVLSQHECTVKANRYMRETLFGLLGGGTKIVAYSRSIVILCGSFMVFPFVVAVSLVWRV